MPYTILISEKGGTPRSEEFEEHDLDIGRVRGNHIVLPRREISKKHSRFVQRDGKAIIVDLKSTNGTWVNGRRIGVAQILRDGDVVAVGDFTLQTWVAERS